MTHGAAGGVDTKDLLAVRDAAVGLGGVVARVLQPYRVRGARAPGSPGPSGRGLAGDYRGAAAQSIRGIPLVQGGRSNGARVACRTASAAGARAVVALAFPLHPPGRPEQSRAGELRAAGTDVLVINGERDPFGIPDQADAAAGDRAAGRDSRPVQEPAAVGAAVGSWLEDLLGG